MEDGYERACPKCHGPVTFDRTRRERPWCAHCHWSPSLRVSNHKRSYYIVLDAAGVLLWVVIGDQAFDHAFLADSGRPRVHSVGLGA